MTLRPRRHQPLLTKQGVLQGVASRLDLWALCAAFLVNGSPLRNMLGNILLKLCMWPKLVRHKGIPSSYKQARKTLQTAASSSVNIRLLASPETMASLPAVKTYTVSTRVLKQQMDSSSS
ncbi:hypothetical protein CDD81_3539 [Ophiocordyceps australis]|uniref:Uncharacterized protein n=1 Tax=Ophiocordyceps australis TaxID=1399860 RepID=A0A2C5X775_9HYPO|nr:hypothetical protein CDD81_3539 [Ophiocordyceps australis]